MAFIRILSPNNAPPVLRLEGSTEIKPIVFSGKSIKKRRTNSSTKEDLPAPPVPVIPKTGIVEVSLAACILSKVSLAVSGKFSAAEMTRAIALGFFIFQMIRFSIQYISNRKICFLNQIVNHTLQSHSTTIIWRINFSDSISV